MNHVELVGRQEELQNTKLNTVYATVKHDLHRIILVNPNTGIKLGVEAHGVCHSTDRRIMLH
jgi:hypothetical protein